MRWLVVVLLFAFVLAACGGAATPDPAEMSRLVATGASATVAALPTPTTAPTPLPAVVVPPDWVEYDEMTDLFTLMHPADWSVTSEKVGGDVEFSAPEGSATVVVTYQDAVFPPVGEDDTLMLDALVTTSWAKWTEKGYDTIRMVEKGVWHNRGYYLEALVKDETTASDVDVLRVIIPFGDRGTIEALLLTMDAALQEDKDVFDLMLSSLVFAP
jgi:hypothetical protein